MIDDKEPLCFTIFFSIYYIKKKEVVGAYIYLTACLKWYRKIAKMTYSR